VIGCVDDHVEPVATVGTAAAAMGMPIHRVNVGPVAEFTSKVVHLIQAHHDAGVLVPALSSLGPSEGAVASGAIDMNGDADEGSGTTGAGAPASLPAPPTVDADGEIDKRAETAAPSTIPTHAAADMHFWCWIPTTSKIAIPSTEEATGTNPVLGQGSRPAAWLMPNATMVAIGRSHGAYARKEGVSESTISFVLNDCVVSVGSAAMQRCMGERSWGALTEHHGLVILRDAIDTDPTECHFTTFEEALTTVTKQKRKNHYGVVLDNGLSEELDLYGPAGEVVARPASYNDTAAMKTLHFFLNPPPTARGVFKKVLAGNRFAKKSLPGMQDSLNLVRTIVSLQGHNNCGRLFGVVSAAVGGGGGGGGDQKAVEQVQEGEGSQDGGSDGEQKQKRRKQVKGAFGSGPRRTKEVDGAFGSGPRRTKQVDGAFGSGPRRTKQVDGAFGSGPRRTKEVDGAFGSGPRRVKTDPSAAAGKDDGGGESKRKARSNGDSNNDADGNDSDHKSDGSAGPAAKKAKKEKKKKEKKKAKTIGDKAEKVVPGEDRLLQTLLAAGMDLATANVMLAAKAKKEGSGSSGGGSGSITGEAGEKTTKSKKEKKKSKKSRKEKKEKKKKKKRSE